MSRSKVMLQTKSSETRHTWVCVSCADVQYIDKFTQGVGTLQDASVKR
jgi:hypothetical protein